MTQHNIIKQTNETCQKNLTSLTYFLANIFDMLEDPCVHVKTQNALIKGRKHEIIEYINMHSLVFLGVKILPKYKKFG
jgi:hypothetical protein